MSACQDTPPPIRAGTDEQVATTVSGEPVQLKIEYSTIGQNEPQLLIRASSPDDQLSTATLESVLRWAQIMVDRNPIGNARGLPRFDVGPPQVDVENAPATDVGRQAREARQASHNPFQASSQQSNRMFYDRPTTNGNPFAGWDGYIILFIITTDATHWKADILRVWHWKYDNTKNPKGRLTKVDPQNADFQTALTKAIEEFGKDSNGADYFKPGVRYPLPVPNPNPGH